MNQVQKKSRIGVYGVVIRQGKLLMVEQQSGPYAGKYDFPGGGIEFSETIEQTLRREFQEEVNMSFATMQLLDNLTTTVEVPSINENPPYLFHQIGLIYSVMDVKTLPGTSNTSLKFHWVEPKHLTPSNSSPFVWQTLESLYAQQ